MPRPRKPSWHSRDRCYYTRIDGRPEPLRHPDIAPGIKGPKVAHGDEAGIRDAVARLLAERDARIKRILDPSVSSLCRDYLIASSQQNTDETTAGKEWVLSKFCAFGEPPFGERPARSIESTDLHKMRKVWERAGYASGMVRRLYREVMACWAWAVAPDPERKPIVILEKNPLAEMKMPPLSPASTKYVSLKTTRKLIALAEERAERMGPLRQRFEGQAILMLRMLAETGCRPKEACEARWEDFDSDQGVIVLTSHKTSWKTGKPRVIVVPPALAAELVTLRSSGYAHPTHLFAHARSRGDRSVGAERETGAPWGRPGYTAWFLKLVRAARKKGFDVPDGLTLYWLRHSFLTDAQMAEGGEQAANLAGNSKEVARGTYLHVQINELKAVAEKVAKRREGQPPA